MIKEASPRRGLSPWFFRLWAFASIMAMISGTGIWIQRDHAEARVQRLLRHLNVHCNGVHDALEEAARLDAGGQQGAAASLYMRVERDLPLCSHNAEVGDHFEAKAWLPVVPVRDVDDPALGEP